MKLTPQFLHKLETLFKDIGYTVRYEKGQFRSGYCILNEKNVIVINKFYTLEGKIQSLMDVLKDQNLNLSKLDRKQQELIIKLSQNEISF